MADPILAESPQAWQGLPVLLAVRGSLAGDDVIEMADGKTLDIDVALPGVLEALNAIGSKDQIEVEGSLLELNEILAPLNVPGLVVSEGEAEIAQRAH